MHKDTKKNPIRIIYLHLRVASLAVSVHAATLRDTMRGLLGVFGLAEGEMGEDG